MAPHLDSRSIFALLLAGCAHGTFEADPSIRLSPDNPMTSSSETTHAKPLLDLRAPQHVETATFALG